MKRCDREDCDHNIKVKKELCCTIPCDNTVQVYNCYFENEKKKEGEHEKDNKESIHKSNAKEDAC